MKAIVSSKQMFDFINKATEQESEDFFISGRTLSALKMIFPAATLQMEVQNDEYNPISCSIDYDQIFKVRKFLQMIPEQPIVIEINEYEDDKISIELSQFVATF